MKNKLNVKSFIAGILITILAVTMVNTVFAAQIRKTITAVYRDIKITIDGKQIDTKDTNGNTVEPFISNGTTYLPLRSVANAVGYDVSWNNETNTVNLSKEAINVELSELTDEVKDEFSYLFMLSKNATDGILKQGGCVNNATTAVEIATAILHSIFGLRDYEFPLEAYYDDVNNYWLIHTSSPEDRAGGPKYIIINAMNAEIIMIRATR